MSIGPIVSLEDTGESINQNNQALAVTDRVEMTVPAKTQRGLHSVFYAWDADAEAMRAVDPSARPDESQVFKLRQLQPYWRKLPWK